MAENSVAPVARGDTFFKGGTADAAGGKHLQGLVHVFPNSDPDDTTKRRNGGNVICVLVRNTHTAAVLPGEVVIWKAAAHGTETGEPCGTLAEHVAGVVDAHLPSAGAAVDDLYWLIIRGDAKVTNDGGIAEDDIIFASGTTAGRVIKLGTPSGTQACRQIGTAVATVAEDVAGVIHVNVSDSPYG